jgi:hypothetical protein
MDDYPETHVILINHLCTFITDISLIAEYANRQFSTEYSEKDIETMIKDNENSLIEKPKPKQKDLPAIGGKPIQIKAGHGKGLDPLAKALIRYHYKYAKTEAERDEWAATVPHLFPHHILKEPSNDTHNSDNRSITRIA